MNPITLAIIGIRGVALALSLQGQTKAAEQLGLLASAAESGQAVDAHMQIVADALKAGTAADWDDIAARIEADSQRLQRPA